MIEEDLERQFLAEFGYLEAEKEFEEWTFWKEDMKLEKEKKEAKIVVREIEQLKEKI